MTEGNDLRSEIPESMKLDGPSNYILWAFKFQNICEHRDLWDVVDAPAVFLANSADTNEKTKEKTANDLANEAYVGNPGSPHTKSPSGYLRVQFWAQKHLSLCTREESKDVIQQTWKCQNTCTYVVKFGQSENIIARMQYMAEIASLCLVKPSTGPVLEPFSPKTLGYLATCWRAALKGNPHSFQTALNTGVRVPVWTQVPDICFKYQNEEIAIKSPSSFPVIGSWSFTSSYYSFDLSPCYVPRV